MELRNSTVINVNDIFKKGISFLDRLKPLVESGGLSLTVTNIPRKGEFIYELVTLKDLEAMKKDFFTSEEIREERKSKALNYSVIA